MMVANEWIIIDCIVGIICIGVIVIVFVAKDGSMDEECLGCKEEVPNVFDVGRGGY